LILDLFHDLLDKHGRGVVVVGGTGGGVVVGVVVGVVCPLQGV